MKGDEVEYNADSGDYHDDDHHLFHDLVHG